MAEREQKKRTTEREAEVESDLEPASSESTDQLKSEMDDLLDEIDEVLETNAEDFVRSYIQKGCQ